jgi:hypothetical protein
MTEDEFDRIMDIFDSTIKYNQSLSPPGRTNIPPFQMMNSPIRDKLEAIDMAVYKLIYGYWKEQMVARNSRTIKFGLRVGSSTILEACLHIVTQNEQGNDEDDCEKSVSCRQREEYLVRKTYRCMEYSRTRRSRHELEFGQALL